MQTVVLDVNDYRRVTAMLNALEAGALIKMVLWQVTEELPLPADFDRLCLLAGLTGRWERGAARRVLAKFADQRPDGWWIGIGRRTIDVGQAAFEREQAANAANSTRQASWRCYQQTCLALVRVAVPSLKSRTNMAELRRLAREHGIELPPPPANGANEGANALAVNGASRVLTGVLTRYASSAVTSSLRSEETASEAVASHATMPPFGEAAKAMRKAGLADAHPGHETLRQLVRSGCPIERFGDIAAEAVVKGKGAAWALATLKGRRDDEARGYRPAKRDHAAELREWAPMLGSLPIADGPQIDGMAPLSLQNEVPAAPLHGFDLTRSKRV